jgi:lysophospholipase L1-like esterase
MKSPSPLLALCLAAATFFYGVGVGRYEWPPFAVLRSVLAQAVAAPDYQSARAELFRSTPGTADVVMLGDSITEHGPWSELLKGVSVINRGISGDTSHDVLARLDEVVSRKPRLVVLMIGSNDLRLGIADDRIADHVEAIVRTLLNGGASVLMQSTLHVGPTGAAYRNTDVTRLNERLRGIAARLSVPFLDVNATLAPGGVLEEKFAWDGVHLTGAAYVAWAQVLLPLVAPKP